MKTAFSKRRLQEILEFISEITFGNYTYTLPLRNQKDELEQIVIRLNTMVEEVDTAVHKIDHSKSKEVIENLTFNLDRNMHICSYSDNVGVVLKYTKKELLYKHVKLFVGEDTRLPEDLDRLLQRAINGDYSFNVEFRHNNGYYWTGKGYLHHLVSADKNCYTLSVFKAVHYNEKLKSDLKDPKKRGDYPSENRSLLLRDQRKLVNELDKYVMTRLDRRLKNISVIAKAVGGSETKIKAIFKKNYGDTIYNYHKRKRLEKAYMLLRDTGLPINEIAEECGFIEFSHFSRSFKKEYGVTPTRVRES
ncbi:helix-turn-helix transcriptional regulator [Antarcticibacterium arcticum]|uniref:Helix-turn-helix transcriptional regulator n=1 Tax=Antarcticibacterium arcticum TaxID=2585771 RepID=A0A5B8YPG8_9FLAO|nr:AraC family transcriptional regulator [Antarcticibacterium arcticum]QED37779.1 helix-turn-helix transcriptional regulator [Antarcticibacterium arcticum]